MFEANWEGCAKDSTHAGIIDRREPMGDWKIVVRGVSSGCKSQCKDVATISLWKTPS